MEKKKKKKKKKRGGNTAIRTHTHINKISSLFWRKSATGSTVNLITQKTKKSHPNGKHEKYIDTSVTTSESRYHSKVHGQPQITIN